MSRVRALVLRAPGTNCDLETEHAFRLSGAEAERVHVMQFVEGARRFQDYDIVAFPGGFSYGDDLGAGTVFSNQLRSHLLPDLLGFIDSGRPVLAICNGFQVLVRLGILPGLAPPGTPSASLVVNDSGKFEDRWVVLRSETKVSFFLEAGEVVELPVAHMEGKFVPAEAGILERLRSNGQVALRYIACNGSTPAYPENPNGSTDDIAGVVNPKGNVLGLMPHPERHLFAYHHPSWTRRSETPVGDGLRFFERAVKYARSGLP